MQKETLTKPMEIGDIYVWHGITAVGAGLATTGFLLLINALKDPNNTSLGIIGIGAGLIFMGISVGRNIKIAKEKNTAAPKIR